MKKIRIKSNRTFGVEIEFVGARPTTVAREITNNGIRCEAEGYNHITRGHWKVVPDGSCGYEIVSPILKGQEGMNELVRVLDILNTTRARVNKKCGIHVHVGAEDATGRKVANLVKYFGVNEHIIDMVVSPSRRKSNNYFCKSIFETVAKRNYGRFEGEQFDVTEAQKLELFKKVNHIVKRDEWNEIGVNSTIADISHYIGKKNDRERYGKLNLTSFRKYRTVEFRGFNGSTCPEKIGHWVNFVTSMVDKTFKAKQIKNKVQEDPRLAFAQVFGKGAGRQTLKFMGQRAFNFGLLSDPADMFQFATRNGTI